MIDITVFNKQILIFVAQHNNWLDLLCCLVRLILAPDCGKLQEEKVSGNHKSFLDFTMIFGEIQPMTLPFTLFHIKS